MSEMQTEATVLDVKESKGGKKYVVLDSGINRFLKPVLKKYDRIVHGALRFIRDERESAPRKDVLDLNPAFEG